MKSSMKKLLALFVCVCLLMSGTAYAQEDGTEKNDGNGSTGSVVINETNFPDKNFREYVGTELDSNHDGKLSTAEIDAVTSICVDDKNISVLTGIGYFTSLTELVCNVNRLEKLDVSKNINLTKLSCNGNQLKELIVNKNLNWLNCSVNELTTLNVSQATNLTVLDCGDNDLTELDVSTNTKLKSLYCYENQLKTLDISKNVSLENLGCEENQLETLDVGNNVNLKVLGCSGNRLTSLDVSKNVGLTSLYCDYGNQIEHGNQLRSLNVSENTDLEILYCAGNKLTALDVSKNKKLTELGCAGNQLKNLDINNNVKLINLACADNQLTVLDVSNNTDLKNLYCAMNQLAALDISKNVNLINLDCDSNRLKVLDVSKNGKLTELRCYGNQLTNLDVRNCINLSWLDVRPLAKENVQYAKEPAEFLYGKDSDDPEPVIDVSINTNSAEVNPGTSRVDSGAIRKAFGIGENDNIKVNVEQKTAAFADQKRIKDHVKKFGDKVLNIYEVVMSLYKDGQYNADITDNFGRLTLSFYAGREYAGKTAAVYQLHENADGTSEMITYKDLAIDGNGMVTITVSKLSTFAVTLQNSNGGVANANAPATGDSANMTVWVALMMLTMTIIPIVAIIGRRQKR